MGPYKVLEAKRPNACKLDLPRSLRKLHPVFNIPHLKTYVGHIIPPPDPIMLDEAPEYEVVEILQHRKHGRHRSTIKYLVSFVGYDNSHNEWLPAANLVNASELLTAYKIAHGLQ